MFRCVTKEISKFGREWLLKEKGRPDKWWKNNKKKIKGSEEIGNAEERGQEQRFFAKEWSGDAERSVCDQ